ncbi:hypothetical protein TWF481_007095 [Arthrobotrys musiformis]|uniref:Uncharacterized protein n=1 Tax=Arthrobotrys musiformis TaxID=47236 RepID=A0AAV9WCC5_9PEZI
MLSNVFFIASLLFIFDGALGSNIHRIRDFDSLKDGSLTGFSVRPGGLFRRQSSSCPIVCARDALYVYCGEVCCYEDNEFVYTCDYGYYCSGSGANAGCCRVGRVCSGSPPPCADYGELAPSPTQECPEEQPVCTSNALGAPLCLGEGTVTVRTTSSTSRRFVITRPSTSATTTSEFEPESTEEPEITTTEGPETTTTEEPETTTTEEPETTTTEEPETTTTTEEPETTTEEPETTTSEAPEETTTTTEVETTEAPTETTSSTESSGATVTPPTPETSNSGPASTVNLVAALVGVAFAFFLF